MWAECNNKGRRVGLFFEKKMTLLSSISLFIFCEIDGSLILKGEREREQADVRDWMREKGYPRNFREFIH